MLDAILYSYRDAVRAALSYGTAECEVMGGPRPPPRAGDIFLAIHGAAPTQDMDNALDERYSMTMTLTQRLKTPFDRSGIDVIALNRLAAETGFNRRCEALRAAVLHMNWDVLQAANDLLAEVAGRQGYDSVYGFCEPMRYRGMETPQPCTGEWFGAEEGADEGESIVGLKSDLRMEGARRLQAQGTYF